MDFGILLQAISYVAVILFLAGLFVGWVYFVVEMIESPVLIGIIVFLPFITLFTILIYHVIARIQ